MKKAIKGNIEFKETQQFRQPWLWLLMLSPLLFSIGFTLYFATGDSADKRAELVVFVVSVLIHGILISLLFKAKFEIIVTDWAVYYQWRPFMKKYRVISQFDIEDMYVRKSPFLKLGYKRVSLRYGRIHNLGSPKGLQFILKSGRKIFIGSRKISGFERAAAKLIQV